MSSRARWTVLATVGFFTFGGLVLDLFVGDVSAWFGRHQFATAMLAEGTLLGAVYVGFDYFTAQAESGRWHTLGGEPLRLIASAAEWLDTEIEHLISQDR